MHACLYSSDKEHPPYSYYTIVVIYIYNYNCIDHTNVFQSDLTNNRAAQCDLALRLLHFDIYYSQHYITWRLLLP